MSEWVVEKEIGQIKHMKRIDEVSKHIIVVVRDKNGKSELVCESINEYHAQLFVKYMNQNFAVQYREETYEVVDNGKNV